MSHCPRIMVVDESPHQIRLKAQAFTRAGWLVDVDGYPPGKPAIDALNRKHQARLPAALVMLSCSDQGYSCIDTLRIIRNYPGFGHQPIIVLASLHQPEELIHSCHRLGVLKCLEWPSDLSAQVVLVMEIKSHFAPDGTLSLHDCWSSSSRLTIVKALTDRIEERILTTR